MYVWYLLCMQTQKAMFHGCLFFRYCPCFYNIDCVRKRHAWSHTGCSVCFLLFCSSCSAMFFRKERRRMQSQPWRIRVSRKYSIARSVYMLICTCGLGCCHPRWTFRFVLFLLANISMYLICSMIHLQCLARMVQWARHWPWNNTSLNRSLNRWREKMNHWMQPLLPSRRIPEPCLRPGIHTIVERRLTLVVLLRDRTCTILLKRMLLIVNYKCYNFTHTQAVIV